MRWIFASLLVCRLLTGMSPAAVGQQRPSHVEQLFADLQKEGTSDEAASQLREEAKTNTVERQYLADRLPSLVRSSGPGQVWLNAVRLSGDLKISEAVQSLADQLARKDTQGGFVTAAGALRLDNDPPGKALAEIGDPAIPALKKILDGADRDARFRAVYILENIDSPSARETLRHQLEKEDDPRIKHFLQKTVR